jgi:hypothetical protein
LHSKEILPEIGAPILNITDAILKHVTKSNKLATAAIDLLGEMSKDSF